VKLASPDIGDLARPAKAPEHLINSFSLLFSSFSRSEKHEGEKKEKQFGNAQSNFST